MSKHMFNVIALLKNTLNYLVPVVIQAIRERHFWFVNVLPRLSQSEKLKYHEFYVYPM